LSPSRRSKKRRKIKENETSSQKGFKEKAKRKTGSVDASQSDKNKKDKTTGSSRSVSKKSRRKKKKGGSLEGSKKSEKDRSTKGSRRSKKASSKWGKREGDSDKSSSRGSVRTAKESSPSSRKARHKIVSVRSAMAHPLSSNKETRSSPEPAEPWYVMAEDVTQQSTSAEQEVERIEKVKSEQFAKSHGSSGSLQADPCVAVGQDAPPSKQISRKEKTSSKKMRRMKKKKKKTSAEGDPRPNNDVESLVQLGIFRRRQAFKAQTANSFGTAQAGNDEVKNAAAKDDEVLLKGIGQLDEAARVSAGRSNNARRQSRPKHRPGKESRGSKKGAWDSNPPPSDPSPFPPPREQSAELQRQVFD
uniref:SMAP domain-containing protein n=1 Tax=Heligmosomoides polygyrus TaxID=6339 RepID=A0A183GD86_HELPZ